MREWKVNAERLKQDGTKRMKLGGGCKIKNLDLEVLLEWIHEKKTSSLRVSQKRIMRKAKIIYNESAGENIVAKSSFWFPWLVREGKE